MNSIFYGIIPVNVFGLNFVLLLAMSRFVLSIISRLDGWLSADVLFSSFTFASAFPVLPQVAQMNIDIEICSPFLTRF